MAAGRDPRPPAIFLMGPTASGKSAVALSLRGRFPLELISVDSAQVYRGMDIGTAKPDAATLARVPHRLVDIIDPAEAYSAARFRADALAAMADITQSGRVPLLVGGTMLYFRTLVRGLAPLPPASPAVRERIEQQAEASGWPALHRRLAELDPDAAARIHPNDPQRIQRALEVIETSGRRISELQHGQLQEDGFGYRALTLVVCPAPRQELHRRIERRFLEMMERGFLDEVRRLFERPDLHPGLPSVRCVGYRQAWRHLAGEIDRPQMVRDAVTATRQLAKRQLTWLRQESPALWYDSIEHPVREQMSKEISEFLRSWPA